MSDKTDQAVATLGDVHVVGQGRPVTGPQLRYAVTVQRPSPFSGLLEQIPASRGMGLHAGDVLTSRAFVSGLDVVFGDGVEELVGRGLMAHEVAHVIQQRSGRVTPMNNAAVQGQNGGESEGPEDESSDPPAGYGSYGGRGTYGPPPFDSESDEAEGTE